MFAIAMGVLAGAVERGEPLAGPLSAVGVVFVLLQIYRRCMKRWAKISATARPRGSTISSPPPASGRREWGISRIRP